MKGRINNDTEKDKIDPCCKTSSHLCAHRGNTRTKISILRSAFFQVTRTIPTNMKPTIKKLMISSAQLMGAEKINLRINVGEIKSRMRRTSTEQKAQMNRIGQWDSRTGGLWTRKTHCSLAVPENSITLDVIRESSASTIDYWPDAPIRYGSSVIQASPASHTSRKVIKSAYFCSISNNLHGVALAPCRRHNRRQRSVGSRAL